MTSVSIAAATSPAGVRSALPPQCAAGVRAVGALDRPETPMRAGRSQTPEGASATVGSRRHAHAVHALPLQGARESGPKREARRQSP
jgi:hypothetical protein